MIYPVHESTSIDLDYRYSALTSELSEQLDRGHLSFCYVYCCRQIRRWSHVEKNMSTIHIHLYIRIERMLIHVALFSYMEKKKAHRLDSRN